MLFRSDAVEQIQNGWFEVASLTGECQGPWRHIDDRVQFRFQILGQFSVAANKVQQTQCEVSASGFDGIFQSSAVEDGNSGQQQAEMNFVREVLFMQDAQASLFQFRGIRD